MNSRLSLVIPARGLLNFEVLLLRESPPDQPVAVEEAPVLEGAAECF